MRLADIEWGMIRGALGALVLAAAIGATLYTAATRFRDAMQVKYSESQEQLQSVTGKYLAMDQEDMIIKEQYPRFVELLKKGVIGTEQRLNWIEVLKQTAAITKIPRLRYEIAAREPFTPDFGLATSPYQVQVSKMKLDLGLLHENDLSTVLAALDGKADGIYSIRDCIFRRSAERVEPRLDQENLKSACELLWFTIRLANGNDIKL
ncbi:MAG: hypothetical protein LC647_15435 [Beggiatoa sp.]|nr:hypothetical protein [Beggiatoa sp.]